MKSASILKSNHDPWSKAMFTPRVKTLIVVSMMLVSFMAHDLSAEARRAKPRRSAGDRGLCSALPSGTKTEHLLALVPIQGEMTVASEYPTLWFFYSPEASTPQLTGELIVRDIREERAMEPLTITIPNQTGIVGIPIKSPLAINQPYHWYFSVICETEGRTKEITVDGWLRRIEAKPAVATQLKQAKSPEQIASVYSQAGLWSDALTTLANEKNHSPTAKTIWAELLRTEQLEAIEAKPILIPQPSPTGAAP
jgi:hypothetical protein